MDYHSNFLDVRNGGCSNGSYGAGHGRTVRGGSHGVSDMPELPVPEPMYGVQPDDSVPVVQKMDPSGGNRERPMDK